MSSQARNSNTTNNNSRNSNNDDDNPLEEYVRNSVTSNVMNRIGMGNWFISLAFTMIFYMFRYHIRYSVIWTNFGYIFINLCSAIYMTRKLIQTKNRTTDQAFELVNELNSETTLILSSGDATNEEIDAYEVEKKRKEKEEHIIVMTHPIIKHYARVVYGLWLGILVLNIIICLYPASLYISEIFGKARYSKDGYERIRNPYYNLPSYAAQFGCLIMQMIVMNACICYRKKRLLSKYEVKYETEIEDWSVIFPQHPLANIASWTYDDDKKNSYSGRNNNSNNIYSSNATYATDDGNVTVGTEANEALVPYVVSTTNETLVPYTASTTNNESAEPYVQQDENI